MSQPNSGPTILDIGRLAICSNEGAESRPQAVDIIGSPERDAPVVQFGSGLVLNRHREELVVQRDTSLRVRDIGEEVRIDHRRPIRQLLNLIVRPGEDHVTAVLDGGDHYPARRITRVYPDPDKESDEDDRALDYVDDIGRLVRLRTAEEGVLHGVVVKVSETDHVLWARRFDRMGELASELELFLPEEIDRIYRQPLNGTEIGAVVATSAGSEADVVMEETRFYGGEPPIIQFRRVDGTRSFAFLHTMQMDSGQMESSVRHPVGAADPGPPVETDTDEPQMEELPDWGTELEPEELETWDA